MWVCGNNIVFFILQLIFTERSERSMLGTSSVCWLCLIYPLCCPNKMYSSVGGFSGTGCAPQGLDSNET